MMGENAGCVELNGKNLESIIKKYVERRKIKESRNNRRKYRKCLINKKEEIERDIEQGRE